MGKAVEIVYKGKVYSSMSMASKEIGCSPVFIRNALEKSQGDVRKFEEIVHGYKKSKNPVEVDGYHFDSLSEMERATGISARLIRRIKGESQSLEDFSRKIKEEAEGFYALGEWYWSIRQASDKLGLEEQEFKRIFDRYSYSQKELDRQLTKIVGNA